MSRVHGNGWNYPPAKKMDYKVVVVAVDGSVSVQVKFISVAFGLLFLLYVQ